MEDTTLNKETKVRMEVRDVAYLSGLLFALATIYFSLKAEVAEAKRLPPPQITSEQMKVVREDISEIKESLKKLEERIYKMK